MSSLLKPLAVATALALGSTLGVAAPLLADNLPDAQPVPLFKLASKKSAKPAPDYLVGTVGVEVFVEELAAMSAGQKARMTLPNGVGYDLVMERVVRHPEGDVSWVGHVEGHARNMPVVVTMGAEGTYGSMETPDGRFGIIPGAGHDWLFDASMSTMWHDRPAGETDAKVPRLPRDFAKAAGDPVCPDITALPGFQTTIDVLFVMAPDFVTGHGGQAGASTRLNSLVAQTNTYYANSNIATTLRRVAAINVNYGPAFGGPSGSVALNEMSPAEPEYAAPFLYVETIRRLYGADMVAFMRGSSNAGGNSISGVAWVGGYDQSPITGSTAYMYSVSGDTPIFSASLFSHELGHNMGNLHDLSNLGGDPNPGATSYARGWTVCSPQGVAGGMTAGCPNTAGFNQAGSNGFGTIMSYWRPTVLRFSSPNDMCTANGGTAVCGSPDGNATPADAVRSMNCTRTGIAGMRTDFLTGCNFATDTDNDGLPNCVESALTRVNGTKDNDIFNNPDVPANATTSAALFAMQLYRDFLGREADADGLHFYLNTINGNNAIKPNIVESFFNSPEFQSVGAPVTRLYFAFFNRFPDYDGYLFQTSVLRSGQPIGAIANNFSLAPEFQATYGSLNDTQYVTLLYQNVLNRMPSQGEIDFHVARLTSGVTRGEVMTGFSESPEYITARANHVYVSMMYVGMLRRAPDQAGFDFHLANLVSGAPGLNQVMGFYNSTEYRNRFLPP